MFRSPSQPLYGYKGRNSLFRTVLVGVITAALYAHSMKKMFL
jgi:hypothetical protein